VKRTIISLVAALAIAGSVAGCGAKGNEPFKDAPRSGTSNTGPADTITMPDGFSNVGTKCDHGNRIYIAFHGNGSYASIAVVPADPTCR
jgi:predicted small lipoprotein YifL